MVNSSFFYLGKGQMLNMLKIKYNLMQIQFLNDVIWSLQKFH